MTPEPRDPDPVPLDLVDRMGAAEWVTMPVVWAVVLVAFHLLCRGR